MKRLVYLVITVLASCTFATAQDYDYYLSVGRPISSFLSAKTESTAIKKLKANSIPVSFGFPDPNTMNYRSGTFKTAGKIDRKNRVILLGPFPSESAAYEALNQLPKILPKEQEVDFISAGEMDFLVKENGSGEWKLGLYDIFGFKMSTAKKIVRVKKKTSSTERPRFPSLLHKVSFGNQRTE